LVIVPSKIDSPIWGIVTSVAILSSMSAVWKVEQGANRNYTVAGRIAPGRGRLSRTGRFGTTS
jgi:hypothetical protein